jgi:hypothetical protein
MAARRASGASSEQISREFGIGASGSLRWGIDTWPAPGNTLWDATMRHATVAAACQLRPWRCTGSYAVVGSDEVGPGCKRGALRAPLCDDAQVFPVDLPQDLAGIVPAEGEVAVMWERVADIGWDDGETAGFITGDGVGFVGSDAVAHDSNLVAKTVRAASDEATERRLQQLCQPVRHL